MFPKLPFKGNLFPFIEILLPKWLLGDTYRPERFPFNESLLPSWHLGNKYVPKWLNSWEEGTTFIFRKNSSPFTFALSVELLPV